MYIDLTNKEITGKAAENALHEAGITVNKNMVPFDTKSPFVTSGIRLGTAALSSRDMKENEMKIIAGMIDRVLSDIENAELADKIIGEIKELCSHFPLYKL